MKFEELLEIVGDEPLFESGLLLAGEVDERDVRKQLSRWTRSGRLIQLRRGLYTLAPPFQKLRPHPFLIANYLVHGSYVSCESALGFYGMIPEYVPVTVSVSTSRPGSRETPLGVYQFHHISRKFLYGYGQVECDSRQQALVAAPEKALLDLVHLRKGGDREQHLKSLRLQNLERLNLDRLREFAEKADSGKLIRSVRTVMDIVHEEKREYKPL